MLSLADADALKEEVSWLHCLRPGMLLMSCHHRRLMPCVPTSVGSRKTTPSSRLRAKLPSMPSVKWSVPSSIFSSRTLSSALTPCRLVVSVRPEEPLASAVADCWSVMDSWVGCWTARHPAPQPRELAPFHAVPGRRQLRWRPRCARVGAVNEVGSRISPELDRAQFC